MDENRSNVVACETSTKKNKPKILWDDVMCKEFIEACLLELRRGNRPGTHFNKIGWENIEKTMYKRTGKILDKKQIKNKWTSMKQEWKLYDRLTRLEIGIVGTRSLIDAPPEWWAEKINENKDYAKFKGANLDIFERCYGPLFRDSVAVGDQTMTPLQFQNNSNMSGVRCEENIEGKGDSDEISLGDDQPLFPSYVESSSSKRKKAKDVANKRSTKSKTSSFEDKLDVVLDALSTKSTQTFPPKNVSPTIGDCMDIVIIPDFQRGQSSAMRAPRGPKETFSYYHSSLRNIIERTFGVGKARWPLLRDMHVNYTYEHQVSIVIASMAIHNFIRKTGRFDEAFDTAQQEYYNPRENGTANELYEEVPATNRMDHDAMHMAAVRDIIAQDIMELRR